MECILKSELFPKKSLVCEDESLHVPFPLLCGEAVEYLGRTADGVIALSNFRLLIRSKDSFINVPLGMVESIECREIFFLNIYCKDATVVRYTLILVLWSNYLYSWLYYTVGFIIYLPSERNDSVIFSYVHQKSLCTQIRLHFKGEFLKTLHAYNDMIKICTSLRHFDLSIFDGVIALFSLRIFHQIVCMHNHKS